MNYIDLLEVKESVTNLIRIYSDVGQLDNTPTDVYFSDAIAEFADNLTDDDANTVFEWLCDHPDYVEDYISEVGWNGCDQSLYHATVGAQADMYRQEMLGELPEYLILHSIEYLEDHDYDKVPECFEEELREICKHAWNDTFDSFHEKLLSLVDDNCLYKGE